MKQGTDNRIAGFSLIEVIVGIAVLGLVTIPLCASLILSIRMNHHSRDLMQARLAASGMVETLMESGIDTTNEALFTPAGEKRWVMTDSHLPEGVDVQAEQTESGLWYTVTVTGTVNSQTVELATSIRREGGGS